MLRKLTNVLANPTSKLTLSRLAHGESKERFRVTVVGGAGGIGQPLSLLLRLNPLVSTLTVYDIKLAKGVAVDLSHIDRAGPMRGFEGKENLLKALRCTDIIVVPAGLPRKPGQNREDLFDANATVVAEIADAVGLVAPEAFFAIITNPLNSTLPIAAEILKRREVYNPSLLFGITSLDVVRTKKFISDAIFIDPSRIKVPVIGGHSGKTIVPLISHADPAFRGDDEDIKCITKRVQEAGNEVVEAKGGAGSATLSMAHAAHEFVNSLLLARGGKREQREYAYVESCLTPAKFFASEIRIGAGGIIDTVPFPELTSFEDHLMCEAMPSLLEDIGKGVAFGQAYKIREKSADDCGDTPKQEPPKEEGCKSDKPKKPCQEAKKEDKASEKKACQKKEDKEKKPTSPRSVDGSCGKNDKAKK